MVALSVVAHVGALGVAVSSPAPRQAALPAAISVELVSDPSRPAPKAPTRVASVAPPRPAPPPTPAKKVLPAKPTQEPKPRAKSAPKREEVVIEPKPKQEKSLEDLLADFREEQGESAPAPAPAPVKTAAVPTPGAPGGTARISPAEAEWMRRAKLHVKRNWVVPPGFRNEPLSTQVVVKLDGQGNVVGTPQVAKRSGNPWYDEGVVRSIQKASPLPAPPESGEWEFLFVPEDNY